MHTDSRPSFELNITGLGAAGEGVGRLGDGRVAFVAGALPGDRVQARLLQQNKKHLTAELTAVVVASPERVVSLCGITACHACALKELSQAGQTRQKRDHVLANLERIGHVEPREDPGDLICSGDGWHYRHRVRLHAAWNGSRFELGYFSPRSHALVPVSACPVLWPELEALAISLAEAVSVLPRAAGITEAQLAFSRLVGRGVVRLSARGPLSALDALTRVQHAFGLEIVSGRERARFGNLDLCYDHAHADAFDLHFEPGVFTQACPAVNDTLVAAVVEALAGAVRVVELHSGIGNFTLPLVRAGHTVVAAEYDSRAVAFSLRNLREADLAAQVLNCSDEHVDEYFADCDAVLLDPPRTGARAAASRLARSGPGRVVYVSCDSATLARDAAILVSGGYTLESVELFDMFAHTAHVEVVARFAHLDSP